MIFEIDFYFIIKRSLFSSDVLFGFDVFRKFIIDVYVLLGR